MSKRGREVESDEEDERHVQPRREEDILYLRGDNAKNDLITELHRRRGMMNIMSYNKPLDFVNVDGVTNFGSFFKMSLFNQPLAHWNVSQGLDFEHMFDKAIVFNQDISIWTFNPTIKFDAFINMFTGARSFDQNLSNWELRNIFDNTLAINGPPAFATFDLPMPITNDATEEELTELFKYCMGHIFYGTKMYYDWEAADDEHKEATNYGQTLAVYDMGYALQGLTIGGKKRSKSKRRNKKRSKSQSKSQSKKRSKKRRSRRK